MGGQNTNELEVEWVNAGQGLIGVTETNALGCIRDPVYYIVNVSAITGFDVGYIPSLHQLTFNKMPFLLNGGIVEISLYNIMGQIVYYENTDMLNNILLNNISSGVYFILLKHNGESLLKKLILSN
ncbi:MAG TPA: T9SS type A sorting domain-containing protein [Bacteroidetes bacterium]|nr:T9SS type A sorting domain-containing protein [Bacteroidota bacterium]